MCSLYSKEQLRILSILILVLTFISCKSSAQKKVVKSEIQWKQELDSLQYHVLREGGTEFAFTSPLNYNKKKGSYACAACKTPLYESKHKYDSGSGWPSFDRAISNNITLTKDLSFGIERTEVKCAVCDSHLGHLFDDGPRETTGKRHCINGVALKFIAKN